MSKFDTIWWTQEATKRQAAANRAMGFLSIAVARLRSVRGGPEVKEFVGTETRSTEVDQAVIAAASVLETLLPHVSMDHMEYLVRTKRQTLSYEAIERRAAQLLLQINTRKDDDEDL